MLLTEGWMMDTRWVWDLLLTRMVRREESCKDDISFPAQCLGDVTELCECKRIVSMDRVAVLDES